MDIPTLFMTKAGGIALLLVMTLLMVKFLRMLYGPKGYFRDPHWDVCNDNIARQESRWPDWLRKQEKHFFTYSRTFFSHDKAIHSHLLLKQQHTLEVVENAIYIAAREEAFAPQTVYRAFLLAALYHDVGRFMQFSTYQTFSDAHSCNHGLLGCKLMRQHRFLATESRQVQHIARMAVARHNAFCIPPRLPEDYSLVLQGVRDADKLDIFRVMAGHLGEGKEPDPLVILHLKNEPGQFSPKIAQAFTTNTPASFLDMRYTNDFRILLCTWIGDLHFASALQKAAQDKHLEDIINGFDGDANFQECMRTLVAERLNRAPIASTTPAS